MMRRDGRLTSAPRPVVITIGAAPYAEGSALIACGDTRILCAASVEEGLPPWLRGQGRGWVTAEYSLLPRATLTRNRRERTGAGGRTQEIQRLIGRSLRAAVDLTALGERQIIVDCDVLQADGGTRTAAITGGYVALALACAGLVAQGRLPRSPLVRAVAAISVGVVGDELLLDLDYSEDSTADMDCNIVMTDAEALVELQATAEGTPVPPARLAAMIELATAGIGQLLAAQRQALAT
jgi:ribonuclease PH